MQFLTIPEESGSGRSSRAESPDISRRSSFDNRMKRPSLALLFDNQPALCRRCEKTVYRKEMVGPINGGIYHDACFKCKECGIKLTLQAYHTNETSPEDGFVYCRKHVPKHVAGGISLDACNLQAAMKSQANLKDARRPPPMAGNIDADAAYIKGPIAAQKLRERSKQTYSRHNYNPVVMKKHEESLLKAKRDLEEIHREQEEKLLTEIQEKRKDEMKKIDRTVEKEWEVKLKELTERFDKMMEKKKMKEEERKKVATQFQSEKEELSRTLRLKKMSQRRTVSSTMLPRERDLTADLIRKQSEEMLRLIAAKDQELQQVIAIDIGENGQDSGASAPQEPAKTYGEISTMTDDLPGAVAEAAPQSPVVAVIQPALRVAAVDEPPGPCPPSVLKRELYQDPDEVFAELDAEVINIAEADQASFTELIHQLTKNCHSDVEKARAIFRWITVKDLSVMDFETIIANPDTPLGILRGIKIGTETYHTLFMRLCSYAGLHCREIKGLSKSVGYEPGMSFEKHNFTNTWNAVFLDGDWRLVQCNWAARHLVFHRDIDISSASDSAPQGSVKSRSSDNAASLAGSQSRGEASAEGVATNGGVDAAKAPDTRRADKLRYQYDEHYFLCDPDQFVAEFFPFEPKWQLLEFPITLEEFEMRPFVRSAFFQCGMSFPRDTRCVLEADLEGRTRVEILVEKPHAVVCHYQLRYADERLRRFTYFEGQKLDRFVVFQVLDDRLLFDIHVPTHHSPFFFEVFAAAVDPEDPAPSHQIKLKCVTKFRVFCKRPIIRRMNPLPPSASLSGEWGPSKAMRHFNIKPLSHGHAVVTETDRFSMQFWIPEQYAGAAFSTTLHGNHANSHLLCDCVVIGLEGSVLTLVIDPPNTDQYSLDLFMHRPGASLRRPPSHVCKYLLNCTASRQLPLCVPDAVARDSRLKSGATPLMRKLGAALEGELRPRLSTAEEQTVVPLRLRSPDDVDFAFRFLLATADGAQDHTDLVELAAAEPGLFVFTLPHIVSGTFSFLLCGRRRGQAPFELLYLLRIEREARTAAPK